MRKDREGRLRLKSRIMKAQKAPQQVEGNMSDPTRDPAPHEVEPQADLIHRYVALGDSFTEGLMDGEGDSFTGWADRFAIALSDSPLSTPELQYANLAVRGKVLHQVIDEQLTFALDTKPDLVSFVAGGNDCMRPGAKVDELASVVENSIVALRREGIQVLMGNGYDTSAASPLLRALRSRVAIYNSHLWTISQRHGCYMLDLWGTRRLYRPQMWAEDRIHLSSEGHAVVAEKALSTLLNRSAEKSGFKIPKQPAKPVRERIAHEALWVREHFVPWVGRRIQGVSSGDSVTPKYPDYVPVSQIR